MSPASLSPVRVVPDGLALELGHTRTSERWSQNQARADRVLHACSGDAGQAAGVLRMISTAPRRGHLRRLGREAPGGRHPGRAPNPPPPPPSGPPPPSRPRPRGRDSLLVAALAVAVGAWMASLTLGLFVALVWISSR